MQKLSDTTATEGIILKIFYDKEIAKLYKAVGWDKENQNTLVSRPLKHS
jgi:hypothetical protein